MKIRIRSISWAKTNQLNNVHFVGEVSQKKLPPYFTSADIFAGPSIYGESFGIVLVEAMACGLPIVAFANQGYKGLLEGTKAEDFLVTPRDYKTFAKKLEILIKDKDLRQEMKKWGEKTAKKYYWEKITKDVLDFYQLCQKKKLKKKRQLIALPEINKIFTDIDNILERDILNKKDILRWNQDILNWLKKNR